MEVKFLEFAGSVIQVATTVTLPYLLSRVAEGDRLALINQFRAEAEPDQFTVNSVKVLGKRIEHRAIWVLAIANSAGTLTFVGKTLGSDYLPTIYRLLGLPWITWLLFALIFVTLYLAYKDAKSITWVEEVPEEDVAMEDRQNARQINRPVIQRRAVLFVLAIISAGMSMLDTFLDMVN